MRSATCLEIVAAAFVTVAARGLKRERERERERHFHSRPRHVLPTRWRVTLKHHPPPSPFRGRSICANPVPLFIIWLNPKATLIYTCSISALCHPSQGAALIFTLCIVPYWDGPEPIRRWFRKKGGVGVFLRFWF